MTDLYPLRQDPALPFAHRIRPPACGQLEGAPALLLLHGVGANELGLVALAQQQDPRLAVILVRSPIELAPMGFGFFQVRFGAAGPVINAAQAEASRLALTEFIGALPAAYGVDANRIWIGGFSQGGILSASLALTVPSLVRGFAILSGRILPEIAPSIAAPTELAHLHGFISHGANDSKLGVHFAHQSRSLIARLGIPLAYHEYLADHELTAAMQENFYDWMASELARPENPQP